MIVVDAFILMVMVGMVRLAFRFLKLSRENKTAHEHDVVAQLHFRDHAIAVMFALLGSTIGVLFSVYHLYQHLIEGETVVSGMGLTVAFTLLTISGALFMKHMIAEETPGHPFYLREYGEEE